MYDIDIKGTQVYIYIYVLPLFHKILVIFRLFTSLPICFTYIFIFRLFTYMLIKVNGETNNT